MTKGIAIASSLVLAIAVSLLSSAQAMSPVPLHVRRGVIN